jgi:hypothetical protein
MAKQVKQGTKVDVSTKTGSGKGKAGPNNGSKAK